MSSKKGFVRDNFLGLSLTLIGVLCLVLSVMLNLNHRGLSGLPQFALAGGNGLDGADIDLLERQNQAYERIAQMVTPAVVYIRTEQVIKVQQSPFFQDPFFRQFFGNILPQGPRQERQHALGSGVIMTKDGYIVTNNHVVQRANSIEVMLRDRRTFKGKVVGADPDSDVAVVKIQATNLPTVPFGDSTDLRVGDTVMAFGNPFGFNFTVTRGSVSALARSGAAADKLEDFIQTDAAINPGNSGGALVNIRGQVVGINTFIVSGNSGPGGEGGFMGLGFAIPSNTVRHVTEDLIKTGKVARGYLGVQIGELNQKLAAQFRVPDTSGALVSNVTAGGPADKAGIKPGDVVRTLNGTKIDEWTQLTTAVTAIDPGTEVSLGILRDGKALNVRVKLGERPGNLGQQQAQPGEGGGGGEGQQQQGTLKGISVQNVTPSIREQLGLPPGTRGVIIAEIDPNCPAAQAGLSQGDVIESINRQPVNSVADFNRLAGSAKGDVLLRVNHQGQSFFVVVSAEGGEEGGGEEQ